MKKINIFFIVISAIFLVVIYPIIIDFLVRIYNCSWNYGSVNQPLNSGTFGDQFGFATSLLSGIGFYFLYHSLKTQRQALKSQSDEFKSTQLNNELQSVTNHFYLMVQLMNERIKDVSGEFFVIENGTIIDTKKFDRLEFFREIGVEVSMISTYTLNHNRTQAMQHPVISRLLVFYGLTTQESYDIISSNDFQVNPYDQLLMRRIGFTRLDEVQPFVSAYISTLETLDTNYNRMFERYSEDLDLIGDINTIYLNLAQTFFSLFTPVVHTYVVYQLLSANSDYVPTTFFRMLFRGNTILFHRESHFSQLFPERVPVA